MCLREPRTAGVNEPRMAAGLRWPRTAVGSGELFGGRLALAVNGDGLGRAADDGRLVLARGRTLSRLEVDRYWISWILNQQG